MFDHIPADLMTPISKNSSTDLSNKYSDNEQEIFLISPNFTDFEYADTNNCEHTNFIDFKKYRNDSCELSLLHMDIESLKNISTN